MPRPESSSDSMPAPSLASVALFRRVESFKCRFHSLAHEVGARTSEFGRHRVERVGEFGGYACPERNAPVGRVDSRAVVRAFDC